MSLKNVYIHIGTRKTGSKSIQTFLFNNEQILKQKDYYYPQSGRLAREKRAQYNIAYQLSGDRRFQENLGKLDDLANEIEEVKYSNIVLSSEDFCSLKPNAIKTLHEKLKDHKVVIVVYLRRQADYFQSAWLQGRKNFQIEEDFFTWNNREYNYYNLVSAWANVFGAENMRVRVFEKTQFVASDLYMDFLDAINLENTDDFVFSGSRNISPGLVSMAIIDYIYEHTNLNSIPKKLHGRVSTSIIEFSENEGWEVGIQNSVKSLKK